MSIESEVLKKIIPTKEDQERIDGTAVRLKALVQKYLNDHGIDAQLKLVGSYSKGTYLSNPDLDLFIMFPPGTPREELEGIGLTIGEEVLHGTRMYAEHPYTSAVFEGIDVDLVPNIHIDSTDKLETAVDRTPFHTEYILGKMKEGQADQIRLLKKFMKGIGAYGAEPNVRGFSGYLCEILVLKYGSFLDVLRAAAGDWRYGMQLALEKKHATLEGSLVFYDPVDGKRNVASAVHMDTMAKFIQASRDYLECPSEKFFFPQKRRTFTREEVSRIVEDGMFKLISACFDKPDVVDDNLYSQVWKTLYALESKLSSFGFGPMRYSFRVSDGKVRIAFILETDQVPKVHKHIGPDAWSKNAKCFRDVWDPKSQVKTYIENGKWCTISLRTYTEAKKMLLKEASNAGIGKEMNIDTIEICDNDETLESADLVLLTELLDSTPVWKV